MGCPQADREQLTPPPPAQVPTAEETPHRGEAKVLADDSDATASATVDIAIPVTEEEQAQGWIALYDGHSLFGWTSNEPEVNWEVADGAITADSGPIGLLLTTVPFADFELVCEYRMEAGGNSGIFVRTLTKPEDVTKDCYEVNIADDHPDGFLTGSIVGHAKPEKGILGSGDWATLRIVAIGNAIAVHHNDQEVLNYTDENSVRLAGQIGLQKNKGKIEFRKVALKPLRMQSLFNGTDLSGWREVPGSQSEFTVEEGVIRVKSGQGFWETDEKFQDFVFQGQAKTHAPDLNSGFFFRAMPGTEEAPSNGYEVQIHNGFKNGDRSQPVNAGTGAIFRRVEARRVIPDDKKWFTTTLVAAGDHIAVWVDGYQVVDWVDDRKADENPRKGLRTEGGHISLQGHDPTTDLSFRNLFIAKLPLD
ncbi:MAG: DUF1080 domain-containing protein [Planctomycetaceae bacterium]|nr:DUF1080 domain-containing protein [Planctomycetaceae bacterium]